MFDFKTIVSWGKFLTWSVPVIIAAATVVYMADDVRDNFDKIRQTQIHFLENQTLQTADIEEIRAKQDIIVGHLDKIRQAQNVILEGIALQTADIEEIRTTQKGIMNRFDKVESGHDRIVGEVHDAQFSIAVELGKVSARQGTP